MENDPSARNSTAPAHVPPPLSPLAQRAMDYARAEAKEAGRRKVGVGELLLGILKLDEEIPQTLLEEMGNDWEAIRDKVREHNRPENPSFKGEMTAQLKRILKDAAAGAEDDEEKEVGIEYLLLGILYEEKGVACEVLQEFEIDCEELIEILEEGFNEEEEEFEPQSSKKTTALAEFSIDLTQAARDGKLNPVIGREEEVDRIIRTLSRKTKNNPMLIGEPGVGKTAIVEGLAQRIGRGEVPSALLNKKILSLDLGGMVAGTGLRGDFEERVKAVLQEVREAKDTIVFIDEIHMLVGAGETQGGTMDGANLLKPALARGELSCIGATTPAEYRSHIEKDKALARRFYNTKIGEPGFEDTLAMLKGRQLGFETFHNVRFTPEALTAAVEATNRHIHGLFQPDKAIDALDEAGAKAHLQAEKAAHAASAPVETVSVTKEDVEKIVSERAGVPVSVVGEEEAEKYLRLPARIKNKVYAQDEAIDALGAALQVHASGLKEPNKPIGGFIFVGGEGVGKNYTAETLAQELFGSADALIQFNMSDFKDKQSVARLTGASPGYVGYEEGGQLVEAVRKKPHSVILFDEADKAHPDVFDALLGVFNKGKLVDGKGNEADFSNTILILNANSGSAEASRKRIGYDTSRPQEEAANALRKKLMEAAVRRNLRPELVDRFEIIAFNSLNRENLAHILDQEVANLGQRLTKRHGSALKLTEEARDFLLRQDAKLTHSARPIKRVVEKFVQRPLAQEVLAGRHKGAGIVEVGFQDGKLTFTADPVKTTPPAALGIPTGIGPDLDLKPARLSGSIPPAPKTEDHSLTR